MKMIGYELPHAGRGAPQIQVEEVPTPTVTNAGKHGEILVRVHFAGLNNFDLETSLGKRNRAIRWARRKNPVVSGIEMAGVVESDGEVFKKGDLVFGYTNILRGPFFHAELVLINEEKLCRLPDGHTLDGATSVIGGALTAITALERVAQVQRGDTVLITGATGSVGVAAVQLASHLGATVAGVCHSSQCDFLLSQGVLHAFAYDRKEIPEAANQFDLVFDTAPSLSFAKARPLLKARGTYISTMPHYDIGGFLRSLVSRRKWGYLMEADTDTARMTRLHTLMVENAFTPIVDSIYPLARAKDAFARQLQSGKRGKILVDFRVISDADLAE